MDSYIRKEMREFSISLMEFAWRCGSKKNGIKDLKRFRKLLKNYLKQLDILIKIAELNEEI